MHAASQDLEVLDLACGALPAKLFDTQIAAGFVGHSLPASPPWSSASTASTCPRATA